jgi:hypothetical protein
LLTWVDSKSAAVKRAGNQVKFVDYDHYVGYFNGRFCEAGVDESTVESNTRQVELRGYLSHLTNCKSRTGLMFYELDTRDVFGSNPWKRSTEEHPENSFEGSVNQFAEITYLVDPGATLVEAALVSDEPSTSTASLAVTNVAIKAATASIGSYIPNLLPDGYENSSVHSCCHSS